MLVSDKILDNIPDVGFGLIMGDIRSGKSVLGYGLLEEMGHRLNREKYVFGLPKEKAGFLPRHILPVYEVKNIEENSVIIFDEAYMEFYSREWQKNPNKMIDSLAGLAGQKEMLGIFITHQSRKLEVGIIAALQFLLYKKPSMLSSRFERQGIKALTEEAYQAFKKYKKKEARQHTYAFFPDGADMIMNSNKPPEWWTEEFSKAYSTISLDKSQDFDPSSAILCLHCDKPAVGICSKCECSTCADHAKTHHTHGKIEPISTI